MSSPAHSPLKLPSHKLLTGICGNTIFNGIFILLLFQDFFIWSSNFCSLELLVKPLIWLAGWKPGRSWLGRLQQSLCSDLVMLGTAPSALWEDRFCAGFLETWQRIRLQRGDWSWAEPQTSPSCGFSELPPRFSSPSHVSAAWVRGKILLQNNVL